jgi:competence protein ComEC
LVSVAREKAIDMPDFNKLERNRSVGEVEMDLLYPLPGFTGKREMELPRDKNNNSLVVRISFNGVSFLFPGDIMAAGEKELVAVSGDGLSSRVLVAPHHGRRSSNTRLFLEAVKPEIVVVSTGWDDRFGALHPEVRESYGRLGARIFTTAEYGAVTFTTDGKQIWVETEKKDEG